MSQAKRQHHRSLSITCAVCTLIVLLLYVGSARYRLDEWTRRDRLAWFGRKSPAQPELIFLAIDNASVTLDKLFSDEIDQSPALKMMQGGYPFPRVLYPLIIERLVNAGARVVAFDMLFPSEKEGDAAFAAALEKYRDKVVLGANLETRDVGSRAGDEVSRHTPVLPSKSLMPDGNIFDARVGFVNFWPDSADGLVRHARYHATNFQLDPPPKLQPSAYANSGDSPPMFSFSARILQKMGRGDRIPATSEPVMFRFVENIRPFSLHEIFVDHLWNLPPYRGGEMFRDKIVVIGPDGNWVKDELETAFGLTNGPRLHFSALNAALSADFLHETDWWENVILIVLGGLAAWLFGRFVSNPLRRFFVLVAVIAALYALAQSLFNSTGFFPIILSPLLALGLSGTSFSIVEQVLSLREKARLRRTFERYVSKDIVKELVDNPEGWLSATKGQRKPITVLFSDVRGFTTLTENAADPHALVAQLNEYFDDMVEIVFANKGTLDKFIGDAVMAHWGSITSEGVVMDVRRAVATAVQMRKKLAVLNPQWKTRGMLELQVGIGVNMGEAIVGNLGSKEKTEVSVIGDAVNLASRLEGVTKQYDIDLCVGENVATLVRDVFILRSLDFIVVKGKTKPVEIFAVLDERSPAITDPAWLLRHEEAVKLYRKGDFTAAETAWREVLAEAPGDGIAETFIARCAELQASPPTGKWDGVFEMKSK